MPSSVSEFDESYDDPAREPITLSEEALDEPIRVLEPRTAVLVGAGDTVAEAVRLMNEHRIGCVVVVDREALIGIFTDRDVVRRVLPGGTPLERAVVGDFMTRDPGVLSPEDPIAFALNRMSFGGYRHVPLVDAAGHPVAVVSVRDIVRFLVAHFDRPVLNLPPTPAPPASNLPPHGAA